jgi:hypothetical protein
MSCHAAPGEGTRRGDGLFQPLPPLAHLEESMASTLMASSSVAPLVLLSESSLVPRPPSSSLQPPPALMLEALSTMLRDQPSLIAQLNARLPPGYACTLSELPPARPPLPPAPSASTTAVAAPVDEKQSSEHLHRLLSELSDGELSAALRA